LRTAETGTNSHMTITPRMLGIDLAINRFVGHPGNLIAIVIRNEWHADVDWDNARINGAGTTL
jgi:hypothetical protein